MERDSRWYFSKDQLFNSPSRRDDIDEAKELLLRQQATNLIQHLGERLKLHQLCINTAIVYMHRFYVFHSFKAVHRDNLCVAAIFLAAKIEEQYKNLETVVKVSHLCLNKNAPPLDVRSDV